MKSDSDVSGLIFLCRNWIMRLHESAVLCQIVLGIQSVREKHG
jgi:hypothetical protein